MYKRTQFIVVFRTDIKIRFPDNLLAHAKPNTSQEYPFENPTSRNSTLYEFIVVLSLASCLR